MSMNPLSGFRLCKIFGIPIYVNPTWFLVFALIVYSLASDRLPEFIPGSSNLFYWLAAIVGTLLFFLSLTAHELGHSLVSKSFGIPVRSITLHMFGGIAQLGSEVRRAREEFWIAIAGPIVSFALFLTFWGLSDIITSSMPAIGSFLSLLALLNIGVALFNLFPGFPLDGGRILRSIVWGISGDYIRATRISALGGQLFGYLLIAAGVIFAILDRYLGYLWMVLLGAFIIILARQSYRQSLTYHKLSNIKLADVYIPLVHVEEDTLVSDLFTDYIRSSGRQFFIVDFHGEPVGLLTPYEILRLPQPFWHITPVRSIMINLASIGRLPADLSLFDAMNLFERTGHNLFLVIDDDRIEGIVTRDTVVHVLGRTTSRV